VKTGVQSKIDSERKIETSPFLLTLYSKSEKATIPGHILKRIAEEIENE